MPYTMKPLIFLCTLLLILSLPVHSWAEDLSIGLNEDVLPLLKKHCTRCHGPLNAEGDLTLSDSRYIARGDEQGPVVVPGDLQKSRLWVAIKEDEMPPEDEPLTADEKNIFRRWISTGASGLPSYVEGDNSPIEHWAFSPLNSIEASADSVPPAKRSACSNIDHFIIEKLKEKDLQLSEEADRETLIRRVAFDLTGLPPTMQQRLSFLEDDSPNAYEKMVDFYLASQHYGERWGKYWLDVAGYADSDGYFIDFDQPRPLAYLYRDYVVNSYNKNKPFDQFVKEQLAGDELSGYRPGIELTPSQVEMLIATHYLRNSEDGTDRNMGTPEERITTRYATLEGTMQIVCSSLMGLTIKCAQCHDHKFEPVTQRQYYEFQSIFYPAFDIENWVTPKNRWVDTAPPKMLEAWKTKVKKAEQRLLAQKESFSDWEKNVRPDGELLWSADFSGGTDELQKQWSSQPPTSDSPQVEFGESGDIKAYVKQGLLVMEDAKPSRFTWIVSRKQFDWTAEKPGEWVQVTFDIVDGSGRVKDKLERFGFLIATSPVVKEGYTGNVLIDSSPAYGIDVVLDSLQKGGKRGQTGQRFRGYFTGDNCGVRVTNIGEGKFEIEHVLNGLPEEKYPARPRVVRSMIVDERQLADGGIGFAFRGEGFHFSVGNIRVERSRKDLSGSLLQTARKKLNSSRDAELTKIEAITNEIEQLQRMRPGKVAWVTDRSDKASEVYFLNRGSYFNKGEPVTPNLFSFLNGKQNRFEIPKTDQTQGMLTTGRRLAFANWLTRPESRPSALLARVTMNRVWQRYFGKGIAATSENLGYSGSPPTHPELLDFLASGFIESGWDLKKMHRSILLSRVYRQQSSSNGEGELIDPENNLLWRAPVKRLDAEAIRDAMLSVAGQLDNKMGGPYVPTAKLRNGEVVVNEKVEGAHRRSLYLQYRRSQEHTLLQTFDSPKMVVNCLRRNVTTVPLQSLSLLNSEFILNRAKSMADRLAKEVPEESARIDRAFQLAWGRSPTAQEHQAATLFLSMQLERYKTIKDEWAWSDFCQALLASNGFLYVE